MIEESVLEQQPGVMMEFPATAVIALIGPEEEGEDLIVI